MSKFHVPFEKALGHFGSAVAIAKALDITPSAVSQWRAKGLIPEGRSYELAAKYPEVFAVLNSTDKEAA